MLVSTAERWKIPVGYFLIDDLNGSERANLLKCCLSKLHEADVDVVSLTCDGSSANLAMITNLGCVINSLNPTTCFEHPVSDEYKVAVVLDSCHMLKLMRNMLADKGTLIDGNGCSIKWDFLVQLEKLQNEEGFRAGNKLTAST